MKPTNAILSELQFLLASDPTTLAAAANALHVHLIRVPFSPGAATDYQVLTPADFTGSAALAAGLGTQQSFTDPTTGYRVVQIREPAGGWHWQATNGVNLPQTIYGWCLTDSADTVTYGSDLFDAPILLLGTGDAVDIPNLRFSILPGAVR